MPQTVPDLVLGRRSLFEGAGDFICVRSRDPNQRPRGGIDTGFPHQYPTGELDRGVPYSRLDAEQQRHVRAAIESYASLPGAAISLPLVKDYESPEALARTYVGYSGALANSVGAELLVPVSELAIAQAPGAGGEIAPGTLAAYLLRHLGAETPGGQSWKVEIENVRSTTYLDHDYVRVELELVPPRGGHAHDFVLVSDVVTHEVRNHVVYVVADAELLGALQYPARRLAIQRPLNAQSRRPGSAPGE